ncbi:hypothetical protein XOC_1313 [Xanthomonas oryzae pv. oryzicola BLS256]|uniref:Uncharacterized protein n=1 Tax=Xanthomonas oryzae pv. oryzicola (strain BLS256) TaxID=383407 RepID=G7THB0_XANOB|nr:hypothetical protein XOC_1313 [Xanthomonas oryzae pv. oryzicola BLS256]
MPSTRSRTLFCTDTAANTPNSSSPTHNAPTKTTDEWLAIRVRMITLLGKMKKSASLTHLRRLHCQHLQFENAPWHPSGRAVGILIGIRQRKVAGRHEQ